MNFKIKNLDHFLPSFYVKNVNFKTRDFSPLIEKVLAGVTQIKTKVFLLTEESEIVDINTLERPTWSNSKVVCSKNFMKNTQ